MSVVTDAIGARAERIFVQCFPDFEYSNLKGENGVPDFFNKRFWVEVKTGFDANDTGPRIKKRQIHNFKNVNGPVVYFLSFHNFNDVMSRLVQCSQEESDSLLDLHMNLSLAYFVNSGLVEKIWKKERLVSKNGCVEYCGIRKRFFRSILENKIFKRNGKRIRALDHYQIDSLDYFFRPLQDIGVGFPVGALLDFNNDRVVIDYLKEKGLK